MKVREIIIEADSDLKHKLAYRAGKQKLADRANTFGYQKGTGLIQYDAAGKAVPFKPVDAIKLKAGDAAIKFNSSMSKFNSKFVNNKLFKVLTIFVEPTRMWIEDCAAVNALYEAGAFPQDTAKQEAKDLTAYYTHIWMSRMVTGWPTFMASVAASRGVMMAVSKLLSKFGLWGKILALPAGLITQAVVIKALQSEAVQHWLIAKVGYFGAEAADLGNWVGPFIPKEWTNVYGSSLDAVKSLVMPGGEKPAAPTSGATGASAPTKSAPATATAQDLIKQLG